MSARRLTVAGCVLVTALAPYAGMAADPPAPFSDITTESGLNFTHVNGARGELLLPEVIGSGGALFDYDNDGDLDLFAVQGGPLPSTAVTAAPKSRLYRNDLQPTGTPRVRFTEVTDASGLSVTGYGMGAAAGDFNNDGWVDLYVTAMGPNRLLRNNGDGTFTDVTKASGTTDGRWSTSATFFDYDADGWLDLFVAHYVDFSVDMTRGCFASDSARDYCNPAVYAPVADRLFHNNRDGTFTDVSSRAGLLGAPARGLGVFAADFNGDGWLDLYVANDGDPNHLWINQAGSGTFADEGLLAGVAVNRMGQAQGSMGVDAADVDGDGDEDLFVTNLDNEGNALYRNVGRTLFEERTVESGLFKLGFTGFGTRFLDYDNDTWPDLIVANGAVRRSRQQAQQGDAFPLRQRNQLFRNERGRFVDVTARAGPAFSGSNVGRGVATGDLDNDGDSDVVIFANSGPARVLLNDVGHRQHWLGVRVIDRGREALQAQVSVVDRRGRRAVRRVQVDGSYCTSSDPRVLFGLGADAGSRTVRVRWAEGRVEEFRDLATDRYWTLEAGKAPRNQ